MTCDTCAPLIEELREEIAQLKAELYGAHWSCPTEFKLTTAQRAVVGALLRWDRVLPVWFLCDAMGSRWARNDTSTGETLKVQVCKIRSKLRPFGIEIETAWGEGYRLTPEMRARLINWNSQQSEAA